jgi:hypothetical protein
MGRITAGILAVALMFAAEGGSAAARGKPQPLQPTAHVTHARHPFTEHAVLGILNKGNTFNLLGGAATGSFGQSAIVLNNKPITAKTGEGGFTLFAKQGSLSGKYNISAKGGGPLGPNGYLIVNGKGTIGSGTGAFKDATGRFTFSGKSPAGVEYFILTFKGTYTS